MPIYVSFLVKIFRVSSGAAFRVILHHGTDAFLRKRASLVECFNDSICVGLNENKVSVGTRRAHDVAGEHFLEVQQTTKAVDMLFVREYPRALFPAEFISWGLNHRFRFCLFVSFAHSLKESLLRSLRSFLSNLK